MTYCFWRIELLHVLRHVSLTILNMSWSERWLVDVPAYHEARLFIKLPAHCKAWSIIEYKPRPLHGLGTYPPAASSNVGQECDAKNSMFFLICHVIYHFYDFLQIWYFNFWKRFVHQSNCSGPAINIFRYSEACIYDLKRFWTFISSTKCHNLDTGGKPSTCFPPGYSSSFFLF